MALNEFPDNEKSARDVDGRRGEARRGEKENETDLRGVMVGTRDSQRAGVAAEQWPRKRRISKAIHLSPLYPFSLRRKYHTKDLHAFH